MVYYKKALTMDKDTKYIVGIGAGGLLLYFGVLDPILKALGIKDSVESKVLDNAGGNPNSPWSPTFYRTIAGAVILTQASADALASTIYDSFGAFNDCEECAIGAFKLLKYQTQLSFLSEVFYRNYGEDLLTFLRGGVWPQDRLSDSDVAAINDYILKLPVK